MKRLMVFVLLSQSYSLANIEHIYRQCRLKFSFGPHLFLSATSWPVTAQASFCGEIVVCNDVVTTNWRFAPVVAEYHSNV